MALGVVPYRVEYEGFTKKQFDLVITPVLSGKGLQEHDDALSIRCGQKDVRGLSALRVGTDLEVHLPEFCAPFDEECRAYI